MQKRSILKVIIIFLAFYIFSFNLCFADDVNTEKEVKVEEDKKELLLVIDNCINQIKEGLKQINTTLQSLDKTEEYEKYPAIRLNIDTPFFGLDSMINNKLKIKNNVSTVDVAKGYSIKDIVNNNSMKFPDFKVGNIVVTTKDVKFDENISVDDAKTSILNLVQYISQVKNTKQVLNNRINNIFEGYIPKEKSEKILNLNKKIEEISNNIILIDDDINLIMIMSNDEISKSLQDEYYNLNKKLYDLSNVLENVLLNKTELDKIEKDLLDVEVESLNYIKKISDEKGKIVDNLDIELLFSNTKKLLDNKKEVLDQYVNKSSISAVVSLAKSSEGNLDDNNLVTINQYDITSKYIIDYVQNLLNNLNDKIQYYTSGDENKDISLEEKQEILKSVIKLYNDFVLKESKFYLDNLNYILKDTTYKLSKIPDYTDANTVKDIEYIYLSLPDDVDVLLDKYSTKSTFQTQRLTSELYQRLLKLLSSNIKVTIEYNRINLS